MTPDPRMALVAELLAVPPDSAFAYEWLERGGHHRTLTGDPEKQASLRAVLPLKYVQTMRFERAEIHQ
jgi:hypothetical protein